MSNLNMHFGPGSVSVSWSCPEDPTPLTVQEVPLPVQGPPPTHATRWPMSDLTRPHGGRHEHAFPGCQPAPYSEKEVEMLEQGAELKASIPTTGQLTPWHLGRRHPKALPAARPALTTHCWSWSDLPPVGCRAPRPPALVRSSAGAPTAGQPSRGSLPAAHRDETGVNSSQLPPLHRAPPTLTHPVFAM